MNRRFMRPIVRSFAALVSVILLICMFAVSAVADDLNGISVSVDNIFPGDEFTVAITVPPTENADTASVKIAFDADAFEVLEWDPQIPGGISNAADGMLILMAANVERSIDLSGGLTLTAKMKAADNAADGEYSFELTEHSFCYVNDTGYDFTEAWEPETLLASVTVGTAEETVTITAAAETEAPSAPTETAAAKDEGFPLVIIIVVAAALAAAAVIVIAVIMKNNKRSQ